MQPGEIGFLIFAVGAITLFGGVLAWASFMEWRAGRSPKQQARPVQSTQHQAMGSSVRRAF